MKQHPITSLRALLLTAIKWVLALASVVIWTAVEHPL